MNPVDITLYAIIDPEHCNDRDMVSLVQEAAANGATLIQYRDKINPIQTQIENAKALRAGLSKTDVPLIINDRVDVALAAKADGVHLGQSDMAVADARTLLGADAIIGLSIKTIEEAEVCPVGMIDYAFVGGVYETRSKNNPVAIGVTGWIERANLIKNKSPDMPIGAIAGIDESNVGELVKAGCDGIAVISSIFMAQDVGKATAALRKALEA